MLPFLRMLAQLIDLAQDRAIGAALPSPILEFTNCNRSDWEAHPLGNNSVGDTVLEACATKLAVKMHGRSTYFLNETPFNAVKHKSNWTATTILKTSRSSFLLLNKWCMKVSSKPERKLAKQARLPRN